MANSKVTALTELVTVDDDDYFYVVDDPTGSPVGKFIKRKNALGVDNTTFTPALAGSTTPGSHTYSVQNGNYARIGNVVLFRLRISISTVDTWAGNVEITGLPLTAAANGSAVSIGQTNQFAYGDTMSAYVAGATTKIVILKHTSGTGNSTATLTTSDVGTTPAIRVAGFYFV